MGVGSSGVRRDRRAGMGTLLLVGRTQPRRRWPVARAIADVPAGSREAGGATSWAVNR